MLSSSCSEPFCSVLQLRLRNYERHLINYPHYEGDIHWTARRVRKYPAICSVAGIFAGLLGIGGGMVKGTVASRFFSSHFQWLYMGGGSVLA